MRRFGAAWRLANVDLRSRPTPPSAHHPHGRRRADGWGDVPGLGGAVLMPHPEVRRYRHPRQSQQPQGGRDQRSCRSGRRHSPLSAALLARSESHRKASFQNSSHCSAKPPRDAPKNCGRKWLRCSTPSPLANAQTTSLPPVM